jgi:nucleotide-binding universal stress UspA family protein
MAAKHILGCVDFSEHSNRALAEVGDYARAHGSRVTLIHVFDPHAFTPAQAVLEPLATANDEAARKAALEKLGDDNLAGIDTDIAWIEGGAPAKAICDYAETHGVDLIVVGSHGRGGVERWLIGSVAERVVRHATTNVYVVRR